MEHRRSAAPTLALLLLALSACGGSGGPEGPSPARVLLAGSASGDLDPVRLGCAVAAAPFLAQEVQESREARLRWLEAQGRVEMGRHARSVQANMASADQAVALGQWAQTLERSARAVAAQGRFSQAAQYSAWAGQVTRRIHTGGGSGGGFAPPGVGARLDGLDGEGTDRLVRYATLRAEALEAPEAERAGLLEALAAMDRDHPEVMEAYAALLLEAYDDAGLPCGKG